MTWPPPLAKLARYLIALVLVGSVTLVGLAADLDFPTASLLLLGAVLLAALRGRRPGLLAAATAFCALLWLFPPQGGGGGRSRDVGVLAAFVFVAAVVGTLGGHNYRLRRKAEQREREARARLQLSEMRLAGRSAQRILTEAASTLVDLFSLAACEIHADGLVARSSRPRPAGQVVSSTNGTVAVRAHANSFKPLSDDDRAVLKAFTSELETVLETRRLELAAAQARVETQVEAQVSATRAGFLSLVSHNLRTPLASIKAAAEALRTGGTRLTAAEQGQLLDDIAGEADRLERLVTKVVHLSRVREGGLELDLETVDLGGVVSATARRLRALRTDGIAIDFAADLPQVRADLTMLQQVLLNLLENALRFAPDGTQVSVSARAVGDEIVVKVADRGPGVDRRDRERIFDEFVTVAQTENAGTGLGLAIVRWVVVRHGGRVWCEPTPAGGATFAFSLPVAQAAT